MLLCTIKCLLCAKFVCDLKGKNTSSEHSLAYMSLYPHKVVDLAGFDRLETCDRYNLVPKGLFAKNTGKCTYAPYAIMSEYQKINISTGALQE